jgi:hypothetical protein
MGTVQPYSINIFSLRSVRCRTPAGQSYRKRASKRSLGPILFYARFPSLAGARAEAAGRFTPATATGAGTGGAAGSDVPPREGEAVEALAAAALLLLLALRRTALAPPDCSR